MLTLGLLWLLTVLLVSGLWAAVLHAAKKG